MLISQISERFQLTLLILHINESMYYKVKQQTRLNNVKTCRFFDIETPIYPEHYTNDFAVFGKAENSFS